MNIVNFDSDVCALTDTGLVRPHNEDSNRFERTHNGDLFVVCDGMGGHVGGATASKIGVNSICQYVREHECTIPQQFLVKALEYANGNIFKESRSNTELKGMGTTACVALVRGDKVWYAHVGDSRIYYYNSKYNILYRLTKDHSVVQALVDQGMITEAEAEHHPEKNKIRKSLGIKETVEAEPCQMPLIPSDGDILLICSDGLSGMMDEDDILEVISTTPNVNEAGKALVELAKAGGGTDNITVQIIKFSGIGEREAVFDAKNNGISLVHQPKRKDDFIRKRWLWIIIISLICLTISGLFYLSIDNTEDKEAPSQEIKITTTDVEKYKTLLSEQEISSYTIYYINNNNRRTEFRYFKRANGTDIMVNWETKDYYMGHFEKVELSGQDSYLNPYKNEDGTPTIGFRRDGTQKE